MASASERANAWESGLAYARDVFQQQVTACQQTGDGELYRLVLAYDHFANLLHERVNVVRHGAIICGSSTLRKCDVQKVDLGRRTAKADRPQFGAALAAPFACLFARDWL